jgi:hypothetical protein
MIQLWVTKVAVNSGIFWEMDIAIVESQNME